MCFSGKNPAIAQFPVTSVGELVSRSVTAKSARNLLITTIENKQPVIYGCVRSWQNLDGKICVHCKIWNEY